jgi:hypothetical protein
MRDAKAIRLTIRSIIRSAVSLQSKIAAVALECLAHAAEHGDATLANELYRGLPTGQRTASLKAWFETYSPVRFRNDETKGVGLLQKDAKGYTPFDLEGAEANPYYKDVETVSKPLTMAALKKILSSLPTKVENAKNGKGKVAIAEGEDADAMLAFARKASALVDIPVVGNA